jgi:hypothetical protein
MDPLRQMFRKLRFQMIANTLPLLRFCRLLLGFSAQSKKKRPTS